MAASYRAQLKQTDSYIFFNISTLTTFFFKLKKKKKTLFAADVERTGNNINADRTLQHVVLVERFPFPQISFNYFEIRSIAHRQESPL